jgi:GNAT superfamily N-acetyltransferase
MKFIRWITRWLGGSSKSLGTLGIGLRAALSGGAPGGWASDHREETVHNTGFNYIAIHAIAAQVAGATVTVFADGDQQPQRQSRRKSVAACHGSFARWKSTYGAEDRETDPLPITHPLVRLLKRPNPYESGANFRYRQAQQIRLTGTCLIWNVPSLSGPTCERYVIPTAMATPVPPSMDLPRGGWRINPVASRYTPVVDGGWVDCPSWYRILGQIIDARQVQMIRLPHAWYLDDGQSPLSAGAKWVDAGEAVDAARYHQLKNGIDPSIIWNLPPDVSPDQDEIDRVQAKIASKYGGPENVGRVMVAQNGTTVTPLSTSPKEMCYTEGFHDFKAAILALHQTPPVAVGLQEPGAYAAYNASMKAWRHAAVQPLCDMLAESDTEHLAPQFGVGLTIEIESATVDDTDLIETQLRNDLAAKIRTKNEWRAVRGMRPLPGPQGDELVGTDNGQTGDDSSLEQSAPAVHDPGSGENDVTSLQKSHAITDESTKKLPYQRDTAVAIEPPPSNDGQPPVRHPLDDADANDPQDEEFVRARLIAEILYGLFGDAVRTSIESGREVDDKAFDPALHPRNERGRFIVRGSASAIAAARQEIARVLQGGTFTAHDQRVRDALHLLTRDQLESLHREHGVSLPPRLRDHLIQSIWSRRLRLPPELEQDSKPPFSNAPTMSNEISVHIQNEDELKRILDRPLQRKDWGHLVGAQPGAVVHVFKHGIASVAVAIEHPHYSALRVIRPSEIENVEFNVRPHRQGQGIGARVLAQQVEAARKHNFKFIRLNAIGQGKRLGDQVEPHQTGYYAWARLGFDGRIANLMSMRRRHGTEAERAAAADFRSRFPNAKYVSDLMKTEEGRTWWRDYGGEFEGKFALKRNSRSLRALEDYLAEKRNSGDKKARSATGIPKADTRIDSSPSTETREDIDWQSEPDGDRSSSCGENADPLTGEDEAILDLVWNRIAEAEARRHLENTEAEEADAAG